MAMTKATQEIQNRLTANVYISKKDVVIANLIGGISWGVGTVIGIAIIAVILLSILRSLNVVPVVGDITKSIESQIQDSTTKRLSR